MHYINKNVNLHERRGVDPEAYWIRKQQDSGADGSTGTTPTGPTAPPSTDIPSSPTASVTPEPPGAANSGISSMDLSEIISVFETCKGRMVLVRLKSKENFWMVPQDSTDKTVSGRIWGEDTGWHIGEIDFYDIHTVICVLKNNTI